MGASDQAFWGIALRKEDGGHRNGRYRQGFDDLESKRSEVVNRLQSTFGKLEPSIYKLVSFYQTIS
jgi:hypothetical protein